MAIRFTVSSKLRTVDVNPEMPLLWVLRDTLNMTGTKFDWGDRFMRRLYLSYQRRCYALLYHASIQCPRQEDHHN